MLDCGRKCVEVFDTQGEKLRTWSLNRLRSAFGIATFRNSVFVAHSEGVECYRADGSLSWMHPFPPKPRDHCEFRGRRCLAAEGGKIYIYSRMGEMAVLNLTNCSLCFTVLLPDDVFVLATAANTEEIYILQVTTTASAFSFRVCDANDGTDLRIVPGPSFYTGALLALSTDGLLCVQDGRNLITTAVDAWNPRHEHRMVCSDSLAFDQNGYVYLLFAGSVLGKRTL